MLIDPPSFEPTPENTTYTGPPGDGPKGDDGFPGDKGEMGVKGPIVS